MRLDIRRIETLKESNEMVGSRVRVKVVKNKVAPPFRQAEFDIFFNQGISRVGEIVDLGVAHNIVDKAGAWYSFDGKRVGQGRENTKKFLLDNVETMQEIETKIKDAIAEAAK
jgi:recombination protein RecA